MYKIDCVECGEGTNDYEWLANWFIGGECDSCGSNIGEYVNPDGSPMELMGENDPRLFRCKCGEYLCKGDFTRNLGNLTERGDFPEYHECGCGKLYEVFDLKVKEFRGSTENLPLLKVKRAIVHVDDLIDYATKVYDYESARRFIFSCCDLGLTCGEIIRGIDKAVEAGVDFHGSENPE
jgi:hypothetical protein